MSMLLRFIASGIEASAPIGYAALGGVFSERSGVINIGLEGIMIITTFTVVWGSIAFSSIWVGLLLAVIGGIAMASIHALATITFKVNQIVSGVAINILALGLARFLSQEIFRQETQSPVNTFARDLPEVFGINVFAFLLVPVAFGVWFVLFRTRFGLRLRSVGENPASADTLGVNVVAMRYAGVLLSGAMCGLAAMTLYPTQWLSGMTGGRGFIALAAMIFGRWHPVGAVLASMLYGFAETFQQMFESVIPIPSQFVKMLPYILAVVVVAGVIGKARGPAAAGVPYDKGDE